MFGEIGGQISCFWFRKHVVMALEDSILYTIKLHIHGFGLFFLHGVICDSICGRVVCVHGHSWLRVSHFL